ncbi:hypothetical protein K2X85_17535 [bacterium]|nr:hypothetical protein [bacterium]
MPMLTDHLWFISLLLVSLGGSALWVASRSGSPAGQRWSVALLLVGGLALAIELVWASPFDHVRACLDRMVQGAKAGDPEPICQAIATDYHDGRHDADQLRELIRSRLHAGAVDDVRLAGLEFSREGDDIQASFVVHVRSPNGRSSSPYPAGSYPIRLKMLFREEQGWKVVAVRRFDIIQSAKEIPLDSVR